LIEVFWTCHGFASAAVGKGVECGELAFTIEVVESAPVFVSPVFTAVVTVDIFDVHVVFTKLHVLAVWVDLFVIFAGAAHVIGLEVIGVPEATPIEVFGVLIAAITVVVCDSVVSVEADLRVGFGDTVPVVGDVDLIEHFLEVIGSWFDIRSVQPGHFVLPVGVNEGVVIGGSFVVVSILVSIHVSVRVRVHPWHFVLPVGVNERVEHIKFLSSRGGVLASSGNLESTGVPFTSCGGLWGVCCVSSSGGGIVPDVVEGNEGLNGVCGDFSVSR